MMKIGRGSGKWNMMMEEFMNSSFTVFRTSSVSKMNSMIEEFGESHKILNVTLHIKEDHVEAEILYNY